MRKYADLRRFATIALVTLVLCACASAPGAAPPKPRVQRNELVERLTTALVTLMPLGDAFDHFSQQDPTWPFMKKAGNVTPAQMACVRNELSSDGFRRARHAEVEAYVRDHPSRVKDDVELLESGAAEAYGKLIKAGIDSKLAGTTADSNAVLKSLTSEQILSFVKFTKDPNYADLRKLAGFGEALTDADSSKEGKKAGEHIGASLTSEYMLQAIATCKVPPSAYL